MMDKQGKDKFIDLWHGNLLPDENREQDYWLLLNATEKSKALTFSRKEVQQKYIKTRAIVRKILAHYLHLEAQEITIETAEYGKPYLVNSELTFNLSHSATQLVVVVSNIEHVGVDFEQCQERKNMSGLVAKCFSTKESHYWHSLPEEQQSAMFFRFWVRKEAFVKAVGRGIALGLNQCEVNSDNQSSFLTLPKEYGHASCWKIVDVAMQPDEICAVVVNQHPFVYQQTPFDRLL